MGCRDPVLGRPVVRGMGWRGCGALDVEEKEKNCLMGLFFRRSCNDLKLSC